MKQIIKTSYGNYVFEPIHLYHGRKKIDKIVAKKNLFDTADILEAGCVRYGLIYGTLLGAVREGDFIDWDEDVDVFVLDEDRQVLLDLLFYFQKSGFYVARYEHNLLSLMRNNDYIDFYFFKKTIFGNRACGSDKLNKNFFLNDNYLYFLGRRFPTVSNIDNFLVQAYGHDWRTPKIGKSADVRCRIAKLKIIVRHFMPNKLLFLYKKIKFSKTVSN